MAEAVQEQDETTVNLSELDQPRWAVISFERVEGFGLTYLQAARIMKELEARKVAGLAVVTDEAAAKMSA